ncbi:MAG TPA: hypothetical protein VFQ23_21270 [Anaerolineales bacterium]|nr:hypothetical protein [Anaerolineales bacterium]
MFDLFRSFLTSQSYGDYLRSRPTARVCEAWRLGESTHETEKTARLDSAIFAGPTSRPVYVEDPLSAVMGHC